MLGARADQSRHGPGRRSRSGVCCAWKPSVKHRVPLRASIRCTSGGSAPVVTGLLCSRSLSLQSKGSCDSRCAALAVQCRKAHSPSLLPIPCRGSPCALSGSEHLSPLCSAEPLSAHSRDCRHGGIPGTQKAN